MKRWNVSAYFPEVKPAHQAHQTMNVYAPDFGVASQRAMHEFRQLPGIRGRHLTEVRVVIKEIPDSIAQEKALDSGLNRQ